MSVAYSACCESFPHRAAALRQLVQLPVDVPHPQLVCDFLRSLKILDIGERVVVLLKSDFLLFQLLRQLVAGMYAVGKHILRLRRGNPPWLPWAGTGACPYFVSVLFLYAKIPSAMAFANCSRYSALRIFCSSLRLVRKPDSTRIAGHVA